LFFKRLIACCTFVLFAASALFIFSEPAKASLEKLPFLDESALCLVVLVALYFGFSRTVFVGLMLGISATLPLLTHTLPALKTSLEPTIINLCIVGVVAWLIWQNDKGFRVKNTLSVFIQLLLFIIVLLALNHYVLPPIIDLSVLSNKFSMEQQLSLAGHTVILIALLLTTLVRVIIRPSHINISMLTIILSLTVTDSFALFTDGSLSTGFNTVLALMLIIGLLIESRQMAFRDQLTEIPSRMALQQYIGTLGSRYVVVMADIDHFKKFNDTHGHDIGDQVLKLVAKKINQVSGGGKAFRYGGEEFTMVFADRDIHQVTPFVEQVRASIENYPLIIRSKDRPKKKPPQKTKNATKKPQTEKKVFVTASFGIAEVEHKSQTFEQVMKQADNALYKAKKAGRNCVKST
jgi:diguanylate cyclase (GGDEF)-like protein